jgi:uncharacterized protein
MKPDRPGLDESLTDAEYDRLEAIIGNFEGEDVMNAEEMDGFFAALICGPATILPSVYLDEIWGGQETPFATTDGLNEYLNLAMRHWNFVARTLASPDMVYLPWLVPEEGEEVPRGNRWARGFLRGIGLSREAWDDIFEEENDFAILLPVFALVHENDSDPETRTWNTAPDRELRMEVLAGLAVSAQRAYEFFRPHRTREARREQTGARRVGQKIGRNALCPCGSGKKYKHCCGNATLQ